MQTIDYTSAQKAHQSKLAFVVQLCVEELCRESETPVFATLTFAENITEKSEAEVRWARLRERLRRHAPLLKGVGVWQRQSRGAWHLHLVIDRHINIHWLRPAAQACGFGSFINLRFVKQFDGFRDMGGPVKVARYISRYVTRDERGLEDKGVRIVCFISREARIASTRFGWAAGLSQLWRYGRAEFYSIFGHAPTSGEYQLCVRLGWELLDDDQKHRLVDTSQSVRRWADPLRFPPDPF
jgi:hypothetical protein